MRVTLLRHTVIDHSNVVSFLGMIREVWVSIQSSDAPLCRPSLDPKRREGIEIVLHSPAGVSSTCVLFDRDNNNVAVNIPESLHFDWFAGLGKHNWFGDQSRAEESNAAQDAPTPFATMNADGKFTNLSIEDLAEFFASKTPLILVC